MLVQNSLLKKILVVEDDADTIDIVELALKDAGYSVIKFNRTISMVEIAAIHPHLVLLDYLLPYTLGNELCAQMKADPHTRHIPVILYSVSNAGKKVADECKADGFIAKPFDLEQLVQMIGQLSLT